MNRILILDDEEIVLVGLRETLRRQGYDVLTASDALAGLELLKTGPVAVIITDQQMPWMTGLEFLAQAKQIQPNATRILITAVLSLETVVEAINQGEIYRFIIKPWLREELLATVCNAVQRYELIGRNAELQATTQAVNQQLTVLNQSLEEQIARVAEQNQELVELNAALQSNLQHSVQICVNVLQTFDPNLGIQARRVFAFCKAMAESLNLSVEDRQIFEVSALVYDIGLVGIPRSLIRRWQKDADGLDENERRLVEQHPIVGQELVGFGHGLEAVSRIIRTHHERYDGTGYPDHLSGDQIPWLSRLLAVVIHYAQSALDNDTGVEAIKLASGTWFDPDAVRALLRAIPNVSFPRREKEVLLSELRPGMVLAQGIYTATGLLLLPQGQQLNAPSIDKVLKHNRIEAINQALVVYC